jgi:hypothetical protein
VNEKKAIYYLNYIDLLSNSVNESQKYNNKSKIELLFNKILKLDDSEILKAIEYYSLRVKNIYDTGINLEISKKIAALYEVFYERNQNESILKQYEDCLLRMLFSNLFFKNFIEAKRISEKLISLDENKRSNFLYLAITLIYNNEFEEFCKVVKNQPQEMEEETNNQSVSGGLEEMPFNQGLLALIETLEKSNISHPDFEKAKDFLKDTTIVLQN